MQNTKHNLTGVEATTQVNSFLGICAASVEAVALEGTLVGKAINSKEKTKVKTKEKTKVKTKEKIKEKTRVKTKVKTKEEKQMILFSVLTQILPLMELY